MTVQLGNNKKHSDECLAKNNAALADFRITYPDSCIACSATGYIQLTPAVMSWDKAGNRVVESTGMRIPCSSCYANNLCPRCNTLQGFFWSRNKACKNCGWNRGKGTNDYAPVAANIICDCKEFFGVAEPEVVRRAPQKVYTRSK